MSRINKRLVSIVLCAAVLVGAAIAFSIRDTRAAEYPLIYCNDEVWWLDSLASIEYSDGDELVPIDIFTRLSKIETTINSESGSYVLRNTESGDYISISSYRKMALYNGVSLFRLNCYERVGKYYTYFYIPLDEIAPLVGCSVERYTAASGREYVRVCDGGESVSFEELLKKYVPDEFPEDSSAVSPTETLPPASETTPVIPEPKVEKKIYLSFDGIDSYTDGVLDVLLAYGEHATFFLSREDIRSYPMTAVRIFAEGHAIGMLPDESGSLEQVSLELSAMLAISSRVARSYDGRGELSFSFEDGCLFVSGGTEVDLSMSAASSFSVLQMHIAQNDVTCVSFPVGLDGTQLVRLLIEFYSSDTHVSFLRLGVSEWRS